ncbi:MAG: FAD-dependent oxidoreductase [Eubacteriales bacterium]|nr:FAD-dependent oxidoreductase [Eubacteriales bacterium]
MNNTFKTIEHQVDLCVVGGGLSGLCAAVAAARHGAKVALMQERPMLGGNASSEVRMWVCGAHGDNNLETGIVEELMMENYYRNPDKNYSIWDGILYEIAACEPNIELLLNCTCTDCAMDGGKIASVTGWQMTTQQFHTIKAALFADCSGDSVLAPLSGAQFRWGREAKSEFGEALGQEVEDGKTMGMSCMIQAREEDRPSEFIPPKWAHKFTKKDLPGRVPNLSSMYENFWYMELGGMGDSIADSETTRDELLKIAYGMWDFVKNDPENKEKNANWRLDWMGILPGKRESRRYVGDHVLCQSDVEAAGKFEDIVAFGGWPMDDHDPRGFYNDGAPNVNSFAPSPYGIPYRCLYSRNVPNLFCAGRNISATHTALSSTRVMATCATMGQAVGVAAAIAVEKNTTPRGVYEEHLAQLKQTLMDDDCYLPFNVRKIPELTASAKLICADPAAENLRNGLDRPIGGCDNGVHVALGEYVEYDFGEEKDVSLARIIWDSDLNRETMPRFDGRPFGHNMTSNKPFHMPDFYVPTTMTKAFRIEGRVGGEWKELYSAENSYHRLCQIPLQARCSAVRLVPTATWGAADAHIFSFDVQ